MGIASDEWLDMTPRMIHALRKKQIEEWQRQELMIGQIASTVANFSMGGTKEPVSPEDFMIHPFPPKPERPLTGEDIMAAFAGIPKTA